MGVTRTHETGMNDDKIMLVSMWLEIVQYSHRNLEELNVKGEYTFDDIHLQGWDEKLDYV